MMLIIAGILTSGLMKRKTAQARHICYIHLSMFQKGHSTLLECTQRVHECGFGCLITTAAPDRSETLMTDLEILQTAEDVLYT